MDWTSIEITIVITAVVAWALTRLEVLPLRRQLTTANTELSGLRKGLIDVGLGVTRLEQERSASVHNGEGLRTTVEFAVIGMVTHILSEDKRDFTSEELLRTLEAEYAPLAGQWAGVNPSRESRLKIVQALIDTNKEVAKSRTLWGRPVVDQGGVQLGSQIWIPAGRVATVDNQTPFSFGARVAQRRWYHYARIGGAITLAIGTLVVTFAWGILPASTDVIVTEGWLVLLGFVAWLFSCRSSLREELAHRPEWMVLFPPGEIMDQPCQVSFGRESQTLVFPFPMSTWVEPGVRKGARGTESKTDRQQP